MSALLELQGVSASYRKPSRWFGGNAPLVVRGVSLRVEAGQVLGVVGESGSGKTTLTKLMLGLLPPVQGQILLAGRPLQDYSRLERARLMQAVFQDPYSSLNPERSVLDIVAQPLQIHRLGTPKERMERAAAMCAQVGLGPQHQRGQARHLSGGQRQRVALARALVLEPRVLVCDEPTSALDVSVQAQILNLLLALQEKLALGVVFVTHNLAVVEHLATHVTVMSNGQLVEDGSVRAVVQAPKHPYTRTLLEAVLGIEARAGTI